MIGHLAHRQVHWGVGAIGILLAASNLPLVAAPVSLSPESPATEVRGLDGNPLCLQAPDGGVLAIVFLWTPCPNSNQYSPTLNRIAARFNSDPVRFVGLYVDADLTDAQVAAHAKEYALEFPIGRLGAGRLARELGVETVPSAVVIDDQGSVRYLGRINDQFYDLGRRRQIVRSEDLLDAISSVLAGNPVREPRTEAIGCTLPDFGEAP
ncbi:redoxin family protein [Tautonia rosea]|uniref:redoxin family protein n=1 Tax=Tautonia rosea TaxID=2728037 RepID=UPI0014767462|nr:redoxin family protein [Tautonia rosea]